jgi:hypothetical protein
MVPLWLWIFGPAGRWFYENQNEFALSTFLKYLIPHHNHNGPRIALCIGASDA